ncbi:MAG: TonB-dependent receptor [Bacteroidota bacterium]
MATILYYQLRLLAILCISLLASAPCLQAQAQLTQSSILDQSISASYQGKHLIAIFQALEAEYDIPFFYREEWIPPTQLNMTVDDQALGTVLTELLPPLNLTYAVYDNQAILIGRADEMKRMNSFSFEEYVKKVGSLGVEDQVKPENLYVVGDDQIRPRPRQATLRGTLYDIDTEEPISGARIAFPDIQTGAFTDEKGQYEVVLPSGTFDMEIQSSGYTPLQAQIEVFSDGVLDWELMYDAFKLEEVLLEAARAGQSVSGSSIGKIQISMIEAREMPSLAGELDVLNSVLQIAGVTKAGEVSSGFNVRGGDIDQNLIMQDGNMVFNSSHLLGFFSVINPDLIKNTTLYKGHIPAQFGGRVSSVLDIEMMDGSFRKARGTGNIGLLSSKLMVSGPIKKHKSSIILGLRGAYPGWALRQIERVTAAKTSTVRYGDATIKLTQKLGETGKLSLFGYHSTDLFDLEFDFGFNWQTSSAGLSWQNIFNDRFSAKVDVNAGRYRSNSTIKDRSFGITYGSGMDNIRWKGDFHLLPDDNHSIHFGLTGTYMDVSPNTSLPHGPTSTIVPMSIPKDQGLEMALYANDDWRINDFLSMSLGLRLSSFLNMGPFDVRNYAEGIERDAATITTVVSHPSGEIVKAFGGLEPRMSARYLFDETTSAKLSYNRVNQYLHLLTNTSSATPIDLWQLSNTYFPAQRSDNLSAGLFKDFSGQRWQASLEAFYRDMKGLVVAKDLASLQINPQIETEFLNAKGISYGVEAGINATYPKFKAQGIVTFSRSFRRTIDNPGGVEVNAGNWFPSDFDSPLNVFLSTKWRYRRHTTLTASWVYKTGRPITVPDGGVFLYPNWFIPYFSERNSFRIPDYHRFDFAFTFDDGKYKRQDLMFDFKISVYNLYGRRNPYSVFFQGSQGEFQAYQLVILGTILPFFSVNFRW